ncbi:unnamed protein product [Allacma fusca]|uniref:Potassium channel domain-containing protein n=1 Tax=Allacma fusca TaxID=39272 RepID=A0A8J2J6D1_9HEXA|nr:unnamed protein product [Allacma fusca]
MSDFEYERRLWPRIKSACRVLIAFTFSHVGVCVLVVGYIICGAFIFQEIESQERDPKLEDVRKLRLETANRLLHLVLKLNTINQVEFFRLANAELKNYSMEIVTACNDGFEGEPHPNNETGNGNETLSEGRWTFPSSFLYSLTVITTIGYGNLTPRSPWGKVTTIMYGIIGMPLFLLYLSNIGDILARGFKWTFARCCQCKWNCVQRRQRCLDDGEEAEEEEQITVPISLCLALMVGYVWGGGLLFSNWEKDWTVLDASYFCFISLSTIGFGDLVPGTSFVQTGDGIRDAIHLSFIFCALYLLLGMALIAMCFNLMQEEVIAKVRSCGRRLVDLSVHQRTLAGRVFDISQLVLSWDQPRKRAAGFVSVVSKFLDFLGGNYNFQQLFGTNEKYQDQVDTMCEARSCCLSICSICIAIVVYILLGAVAFFFLESHYQRSRHIAKESIGRGELEALRNNTVQRLWALTMELNVFYESNWTQLAELELQKFQDDIMKQLLLTAESENNNRRDYQEEDSFGNFPAALLYCVSIISTIGYGSVSPKSMLGRILTVFYAAVGIPLTLCYLATVGDFMSRCIRTVYSKVMRKTGCSVPIPVSLILVFFYLCGGAGVFWWLEGWSFVDAVFFCFASLATIGFGGMLDPHSKHISLLVSSVYILLGMALISTVFNLENQVGLHHISLEATHPNLVEEYFVPKSMVTEFSPQPNIVEMATGGFSSRRSSATLPRSTRPKTVTFEDEKLSKEAPPDVFM